jgi:two-component system alkaline phosphatase synthesis response regulator PhoP
VNNIWVVDDDEEMVQAVSLMLKMLDCKARAFRDARSAARALLAGDCPELILLDINMPEVSGLDLLEFIRRRGTWKKMPVLMISTEAVDAQIDRALELGADGYLVKPVTIDELEEAIINAFKRQDLK